MKIIEITTTEVFYPDVMTTEDGTLSSEHSTHGKSQLFVHIKTNIGIEGLGIGQSSPGVREVIETDLKTILINQNPLDIEYLWTQMYRRIRSYGRKGIALCAISALDIGLWDLKAKILKLPLYKLLGPYTDKIPVYGSGGWTNLSESDLVKSMLKYQEMGFTRVKMKVGKNYGESEREDILRVQAVRKAVGNDVALYIDANTAYYVKQAIYMAKEFEQMQVGWFEEPTTPEDITGLAEIRSKINIPVATGELEYTKFGFKQLLQNKSVDIVQPNVGRVGGITEWLKVANLAQAFNVQIAPHACMLVNLHLACNQPNIKAIESVDTEHELDKVLYTEIPQQKNGIISPFPDKHGLGLELNPYSIQKWSI